MDFGSASGESQPDECVGDRLGGHRDMEVPRSKNLLDAPPSSPRFGSRVPVGVREKKVGARHAIPADGTRDALRKEGERERWDFRVS